MLLLAPTDGHGGGIERYLSTVRGCLETAGVEVHRRDMLTGGSTPSPAARRTFTRGALLDARRLRPLTCVISGHPNLAPVGVAAAVVAGARSAPVVFHATDIWGMPRATRALLSRPTRASLVTVSAFSAGALSAFGIARVLPPGVAPGWRDTLLAAGARRPPPGPVPTVLTVFRLDDWERKGLPVLLAALAQVRRSVGPVRLVVAGHGPVPDDLRLLVDRHEDVTVIDTPSDAALAGLYAAAELSVLCTRTRTREPTSGEGYGIVLLESQLAGCPVVGPASGGSSDAYQDGLSGRAPVDESAAALADVLTDLLGDRTALAAMGRHGALWAERVSCPRRYARRVVACLTDGTTPANGMTGETA